MCGRPGRWLVVALCLAFLLRLGAAFYWEARFAGDGFHFGDSQGYWDLGRAIAHGGPYRPGEGGPQVFRAPGYPILLAPIFLVFGDEPPIMVARVQAVLFGTLAVFGVWLLARRLFDEWAATLAALAAAVYPGLIALSVPILTEAPFCALLPFQLWLWVLAWQASTSKSRVALALAVGLLGAAITLVRPSWLLFMPFAIGLGVVFGREKPRHLLIATGIMAGLIAGMAPWWIRNAPSDRAFCPDHTPSRCQPLRRLESSSHWCE